MNYPRMRKLIGSLLGRTPSIEAPVSSPTPDPSSWIVESTPDYIPEGAAGRLLVDPRFWTAFFNVAFPWNSLDTNVVAEAIGLSDEDVLPYPMNPNGAQLNVAGLCDETGRVFGLMPHPERHIDPTHHPRWTREQHDRGDGLALFENAVRYFA